MSDETMEIMRRVQDEHRVWAAHNFPDATADQSAFGIIEEIGELSTALGRDCAIDAVGDVLLYSIHHANLMGWDLAKLTLHRRIWEEARFFALRSAFDAYSFQVPQRLTGRFARARLKRSQGIRGNEDHDMHEREALADIVGVLEFHCLSLGTTTDYALAKTWAIVKQRDWKADPVNGGGHSHEGGGA